MIIIQMKKVAIMDLLEGTRKELYIKRKACILKINSKPIGNNQDKKKSNKS